MSEDAHLFPSNTTLPYKGTIFTETAREAFLGVEKELESLGRRVTLTPPPTPYVALGRFFRVNISDFPLAQTWKVMIAHGFTPWLRYPVEGSPDADLYVYHGVWQVVYDRLLISGLGVMAFPSLCEAFRCGIEQVAPWVKVAALLHLRGLDAGPLTGYPSQSFFQSLAAVGVVVNGHLDFDSVAATLASRTPSTPKIPSGEIVEGSVSFRGGGKWNCQAAGGVSILRGGRSVKFKTTSPGRIVIDLLPGK